mgnify:FL=1
MIVVLFDCFSTISGESEESESSGSDDEADDNRNQSERISSSSSSEDDEDKVVFADDPSSPQFSPTKSSTPRENFDHKMEVDSSDGEY